LVELFPHFVKFTSRILSPVYCYFADHLQSIARQVSQISQQQGCYYCVSS
jgi:hypothetical protein